MLHKSFCISLGRASAELRDTLLSAWSQVGICSITHDIGHLSPVSPLSRPALAVHRPRELGLLSARCEEASCGCSGFSLIPSSANKPTPVQLSSFGTWFLLPATRLEPEASIRACR